MLRIVDQITEHLLKRLPSQSDAYTLEELRKAGFPLFLVEKIHTELLRNLSDSISLPETEWANIKSDRVHSAWQAFLATIEAEVLLPESYKRSVVENSVDDVLEQLVTPRKKLIEIIFGSEEGTVGLAIVRERSEEFVVYPYLGRAITRYLERKNQADISRDRAEVIITKVDERVTGHYSPLNWGQLLEPWFELMGDELDTDLVRRFFEDKGLDKNAAIFESAPEKVNRARFIELLTAGPQIEEEQAEDSDYEEEMNEPEPEEEETPEIETIEEDPPKQSDENEVVFTLSHKNNSEHKKQEETGEKEQTESPDVKNGKESPDVSISEKFKSEKSEGDLPMWQKFLSAEESEENEEDTFYNSLIQSDEQPEEEDKTTLADTFISKYRAEETGDSQEEKTEGELNKIHEILEDHEQAFIDQIFHGDRQAYTETIDRLGSIDNWREASGYLYREVFKHHGVSLYSDEAIEFTDRLQKWYQKK